MQFLKPAKSLHQRLLRIFVRLAGWGVAFLFLVALYAYIFGFPAWAVKKTSTRLSRGGWTVSIGSIKLNVFSGLVMRDVSVFRKRVVGKPFFQAEELILDTRPRWKIGGSGSSILVSVTGGELRPEQWLPFKEKEDDGDDEPFLMKMFWKDCKVWDCQIQYMEASLFSTPERLTISEINALVGTTNRSLGALRANIEYDFLQDVVLGNLDTGFDPSVLNSLLRWREMGYLSGLVNAFRWYGAMPVVSSTFRYNMRETGEMLVHSQFVMEDFSYNGVRCTSGEGTVFVDYSDGSKNVLLSPLQIVREEGSASLSINVDLKDDVVSFSGESTVDPRAMFVMIELLEPSDMEDWRFEGPVLVQAVGQVDLNGWDRTDFEAKVSCRNAGIGRWMVDGCSFDTRMKSFTNVIASVEGLACGGHLIGDAIFLFPHDEVTNTFFEANLNLKEAKFGLLAGMLAEKDMRDDLGIANFTLGFGGNLNDPNGLSLIGKGSLSVRKGNVFTIPLFGGLSEYMTKIVPGLDLILKQSDAKADFTIGNGYVVSENVKVEGDVISLSASGKFSLAGELDFYAQISLMKQHTAVAKLLKVVIYPISKLFEFRLKGALDKPEWYPVNFSSDLLERLGLKKSKKR